MAEKTVDWRFDVPPELSGVLVRKEFEVTPNDDDERLAEFVEVVDESLDDSDANYDLTVDNLEAPGSITVVSQRINTLDDGTQLADLVIDIEDVFGASKYFVKYVKV